jgi:uncharacterized membrane protein (UPF0127 family)
MRFPIDVVWCTRDGRVVRMARLAPNRVSRAVIRSRFVLEAEAGATQQWRLAVGDRVAVVDGGEG